MDAVCSFDLRNRDLGLICEALVVLHAQKIADTAAIMDLIKRMEEQAKEGE